MPGGGNTCRRVRLWGFVGEFGSGPAENNRIGGPDLADRNFITGYGNLGEHGVPSGTTVQIFDTTGTLVENNWIGTTPDGLSQGNPASTVGVGFEGENHGTIIRGNRIAGIFAECNTSHCNSVFGRAIDVTGAGSAITIVGNTIGLDANDEPLLGSVFGIDVGSFNYAGVADIEIGGTNPGDGNINAGHHLSGVVVARDVADVRISGNSIYANQQLGIDLVPTGRLR